jgi:hypothetical protein
MANLTGEGVKSFVSAEKALIESMIKPRKEGKVHEGDRRPAQRRTRAAHAAA